MMYLSHPSEYDRFPKMHVPFQRGQAISGFSSIVEELQRIRIGIIAFELYPGVDKASFKMNVIDRLAADLVIDFESARKSFSQLSVLLDQLLTDDRVFGMMSDLSIENYYEFEKINAIKAQVLSTKGLRIVYGFGAATVPHDHLVYVDVSRWEIQLRFRKGMPNFSADNPKEDNLKKFKRGYFADWRVADKIKKEYYPKADYLISGDDPLNPVMITQSAFRRGLDRLASAPFRLIPYFDPGIWGGQWMKEVCNLPENGTNYAWCFDGVPEENALCLSFDGNEFVFPAVNLVFFKPIELLGKHVYDRFGAEFPIRFDFLDTMGGGNLSLQVHPVTEYIRKTFGMDYTQDESYYILDATDHSSVYLGLKPDIDKAAFIADLEAANKGEKPFDDTKYVNNFPAKKHDHFLIPSGTVHCSGKDTMVLEISATTYIFTFKLWDWGRLGLDGLPRPVHVNHGKNVIQYERDTDWVQKNLINRFERISDHEVKTGLHELEFIETRRLTVETEITTETTGSVNMLNLVEGRSVEIFAIDGAFEPFIVHYAETFIVPAAVTTYGIRNLYPEKPAMVIKAYIRK
ncbi:MAG: mannose-6-phosphate isomerase [Tenericutes bacterium GWF2_57_13]|nr:MAG: mannose-6-phosphate isomerase [Tenericutes bacterium GWF2_57_13]